MSQYWRAATLQCIFLYLIAMLPFNASAAEENYNPSTGIAGTPVERTDTILPEQNGGNGASSGKRKKADANGNDEEAVTKLAPNVKMTVPQVLAVLRTTRDLSGRNLSGLSLIGLNMSRANLKGADLSNANLERADFTESNLERVSFRGANMKMASFFQSAVTAADMDGAVLDNAIWLDKQVCAKGSIGRCIENTAPAQPSQTTQAAPTAAQDQPVQAAQPMPPPAPATQPTEPPASAIQPAQPTPAK